MAALPDAARAVIVNAYNDALTPIFLLMVPLMLVAAALLVFVVEKPLATRIEKTDVQAASNAEVFEGSLSTGANATAEPVLSTRTGSVHSV